MARVFVGIFIAMFVMNFCLAEPTKGKDYESSGWGSCDSMIVNTSNGDMLKGNAVADAKAFCASSGLRVNIGRSKQDFIVTTSTSTPTACNVTGRIECYANLSSPVAPSSNEKIQNCEIKSVSALGWTGGNKHEYCTSRGWNGGEIPNDTGGYCWKFDATKKPQDECPRLNHYYQHTGGMTCQHITDEDAKKLHVCSHHND